MPEHDNNNDREPNVPRPTPRAPFFWLIVIAVIVLLVVFGSQATNRGSEKPSYGDIQAYIREGKVSEVVASEENVTVTMVEGAKQKKVTAEIPPESAKDLAALVEKANQEKGYKISFRFERESKWLYSLLVWLGPSVLLLLFIYFFFIRQMRQAGGAGVLNFGKARAKLHSKEHTGITFADVAGIEEAKLECQEIIEFLRDPKRFQRLGGRIPRGVLLIGPPGTGKTLLAKAIAGEADVPFYSISGSDFVEMFVGVGASRVRDLFQKAKANSPCIIFLDEIDAVGRRRGHGWGGGHDEREQTLNAILVEMDGFDTNEKVIVLAATNRPDVLDQALLRPGRFDRQIMVDLPDVKGREEILKVHARRVKLGPNADLAMLARGTPMFSGADLEAIINEAAILAAMKDKDFVEQDDLEESRDKVRWGREKRSRVMDERDKRVIAFHEAGHAMVAKLLPEVEPLHKVTIIPRGPALGETMQLPEKDRYIMPRRTLLGNVKMLYAGRISESMFCDDISSGAQSDIRRATDLINKMVREWGMSERIGPISYMDDEEKLYGGEVVLSKSYSDATAVEIDKEVTRISRECYAEAERLLTEHRDHLDRLASALLRYEVLDADDVDDILAGREPRSAAARLKRNLSDEDALKSVEEPRAAARPLEDEDLPATGELGHDLA